MKILLLFLACGAALFVGAFVLLMTMLFVYKNIGVFTKTWLFALTAASVFYFLPIASQSVRESVLLGFCSPGLFLGFVMLAACNGGKKTDLQEEDEGFQRKELLNTEIDFGGFTGQMGYLIYQDGTVVSIADD